MLLSDTTVHEGPVTLGSETQILDTNILILQIQDSVNKRVHRTQFHGSMKIRFNTLT